MVIETNAKRIVKVMKGETEVWSDPAVEWLPCTTFKGDGSQHTATESIVLMHDNGDGTAILAGSVFLGNCKSGNLTVVKPPSGYSFTAKPSPYFVKDFAGLANITGVSVLNGNIIYNGNINDSYDAKNNTIILFGYPVPNTLEQSLKTTNAATKINISKI